MNATCSALNDKLNFLQGTQPKSTNRRFAAVATSLLVAFAFSICSYVVADLTAAQASIPEEIDYPLKVVPPPIILDMGDDPAWAD